MAGSNAALFGYQTYFNQSGNQFAFNDYVNYRLDWPWINYTAAEVVIQIIQYYANLLILQYHDKPKAVATIETLVGPVVMNVLPTQVQNGFDITTAVGVQLDTLGKYVGVVRSGYGPGGVPITLSDDDFRVFIQLSIVNNAANASLASIQALLHTYFDNEIFVFDNRTMRLSYYVSNAGISEDVALLFVTEGKLPKPLGVQLSTVIYGSVTLLQSFFGCQDYATYSGSTQTPHISPLNCVDTSGSSHYAASSYVLTYPMLSYTYALT